MSLLPSIFTSANVRAAWGLFCGVTQRDKTNRKWSKSENEPKRRHYSRGKGLTYKEGIRGQNGKRERCEKASADNGATPGRYNSYGDGDVVARVNNEKESNARGAHYRRYETWFVTPTQKNPFVQKSLFHKCRYTELFIYLFIVSSCCHNVGTVGNVSYNLPRPVKASY